MDQRTWLQCQSVARVANLALYSPKASSKLSSTNAVLCQPTLGLMRKECFDPVMDACDEAVDVFGYGGMQNPPAAYAGDDGGGGRAESKVKNAWYTAAFCLTSKAARRTSVRRRDLGTLENCHRA